MKDWKTLQIHPRFMHQRPKTAAAIALSGILLGSSAFAPCYGAQAIASNAEVIASTTTAGQEAAAAVQNRIAVTLHTPAQRIGDTLYVPLAEVAQALGFQVQWNGAAREITAQQGGISLQENKAEGTSQQENTTQSTNATTSNESPYDGYTLRLPVGVPYAYVNGVIIALPDAACLLQGRTMVSPATLKQLFACEVHYDAAANTLTLQERPAAASSLTYEAAARAATRKNSSYYDLQVALSRVEDSNDRLYLSPGSYQPSQIQAKDALNLQEKWLEQQLGLAAQGIAVNVSSQMNQLQMKQEQLSLLQDTKETMEYVLRMETLKYEHGALSRREWEAAQAKVTAIDAQITTCQAELSRARLELGAMLGQPITQETVLKTQFTYAPVTEEDKEQVLRTQVESDPYLWYAREEWSQKDYRLRTYDYMTDYYGGGVSYPAAQLDLDAATHQVAQIRTQLKETIEQRYAQLKEIEAAIAAQELELQEAIRSATTVQLQYTAGVATLSDCRQAQLQIPTLIYQIRALQLQHSTAKTMFLQPYLQPSYVSGGQA